MSMINNNFDTISTLFGSLSTGNANDMLFSDYASLKDGSYGKLLKAYYKETGSEGTPKKTTSTQKEGSQNETNATLVKNAASNLAKASDALSSPSLFAKKAFTGKDENGDEVTTEDYNRDAIYHAINDFVTAYNSAIKTNADKGSDRVVKQTLNMQYATTTNSKLLSKIGITIGKDNSLSLDKEKLNNADIRTLDSLFGSSGSYGQTIHAKASIIYSSASNSAKNTYKADGNYIDKLMSGNIYNGLV